MATVSSNVALRPVSWLRTRNAAFNSNIQLSNRVCSTPAGPFSSIKSLPLGRRRLSFATNATDKDGEQTLLQAGKAQQEDDDELLIEKQLRKKKKKKAGPTVIAPQVQQAYGDGPQTAESQLESAILFLLALLFIFILLAGIFLAASGFLSDELDQFAQNVVYPGFSPLLGVFLTCSSLYGLWKTYGQQR